MDTYSKMCEMAVKIQEDWKPVEGDYACVVWSIPSVGGLCKCLIQQEPVYGLQFDGNEWLIHNGKYLNEHSASRLKDEDPDARVIFLPRQDQLQEMWKSCENDDALGQLIDFYKFATLENISLVSESMEQLWLAFVMHEKFNKTWNGEDWI